MEPKHLMILFGTILSLIGIFGMPYMPMSIFSIVELEPPEGMPYMSWALILVGLALIAGGARMK